MSDPFIHHPRLRGLINDPEASSFRKQDMAATFAWLEENGIDTSDCYTDEQREANRTAALADRRDQDLWVFAYGSLMWDPGFYFAEVRRAHVPGHSRQFILKDDFGGRGTVESPGLQAVLDVGGNCDGLAFRVARDVLEEESSMIWRREYIAPAYHPVFLRAEIADDEIEVLAFLADHEADIIQGDLTWDEKISYLARGEGLFGSSFEYIENIVERLEQLGIEDAHLRELYEAAKVKRA